MKQNEKIGDFVNDRLSLLEECTAYLCAMNKNQNLFQNNENHHYNPTKLNGYKNLLFNGH